MKQITSWETLLEVAHPLAVEKGWWDDMDRPIDEQCANFHAEISEAWEEYRSRRMDTWFDYPGPEPLTHDDTGCPGIHNSIDGGFVPLKPEGFWVEIADLLVRLADTCGRYGWKPVWCARVATANNIPRLVTALHACVSDMEKTANSWAVDEECSECERGGTAVDQIEIATAVINDAANLFGVNLWPIVNEKVAYNRTRPHRHGGKVA